jgi:hypothetical protein
MPRKLHTIRVLSLLPFLAILFIAVGIPVIHPALHDHAGIHSHWSHLEYDCSSEASLVSTAETNECPLCTFLATNHLQQVENSSVAFQPIPIPSLLSTQREVIAQNYRYLPESRGPPDYTS